MKQQTEVWWEASQKTSGCKGELLKFLRYAAQYLVSFSHNDVGNGPNCKTEQLGTFAWFVQSCRYSKSWTPDDEWNGRSKHAELSKNCRINTYRKCILLVCLYNWLCCMVHITSEIYHVIGADTCTLELFSTRTELLNIVHALDKLKFMFVVMIVSIQKMQTNIATCVYPQVTHQSSAEKGRHTVDREGTHYTNTAS